MVLISFLGPTVHREVGSLSRLARICFFPVVGVEVALFILTVKCPVQENSNAPWNLPILAFIIQLLRMLRMRRGKGKSKCHVLPTFT